MGRLKRKALRRPRKTDIEGQTVSSTGSSIRVNPIADGVDIMFICIEAKTIQNRKCVYAVLHEHFVHLFSTHLSTDALLSIQSYFTIDICEVGMMPKNCCNLPLLWCYVIAEHGPRAPASVIIS